MRWLDGEFVAGDSPAVLAAGTGLLETMIAIADALPLFDRHLDRARAGAARLGLPFAPPRDLRAAAARLLVTNGHTDGILRLALLPGPGGVRWELTTRSRAHALARVLLVPTVARRPAGAPPADLKALPRGYYDAVLAEAQAGGADDGIVLGDDGAVLETATANLWLLHDGVWVTPALDGRVLPGIARALLLAAARARGRAVAERRVDLADLHRAAGLCISNAAHGPRPAALVGQPFAVDSLDSPLPELWRAALIG